MNFSLFANLPGPTAYTPPPRFSRSSFLARLKFFRKNKVMGSEIVFHPQDFTTTGNGAAMMEMVGIPPGMKRAFSSEKRMYVGNFRLEYRGIPKARNTCSCTSFGGEPVALKLIGVPDRFTAYG